MQYAATYVTAVQLPRISLNILFVIIVLLISKQEIFDNELSLSFSFS